MFDNYTDELEYSLKEQERSDSAGSAASLRTHIGEIRQEMPRVKIIKSSCKTPKTNLGYWISSPNISHMKTNGKI